MEREHKGSSIIDQLTDYTCFDLETTGLSPEWDSIIEIGAAKVRDNQIVEKYSQLINPQEPIPQYITEITGITTSMVQDQPTINDILPDFITWLGDDILMGHNVNFDINFIYDNSLTILNKPITNNYLDTLRLARLTHPEEPHNRLQDLIQRYNIADTQEHRALADVEQTIAVYNHIITMYKQEGKPLPTIYSRSRSANPLNFHRSDSTMVTIDLNETPTPDPYFTNLTFVITGALSKMTRTSAHNAILNLGGKIGTGVTKQTNYLITGNTEYNASLRGNKSSKWKKAEQLKENGQDIHIIDENTFYDMLQDTINEAPTISQVKAQKPPKPGKGTMWDTTTTPANTKPEGTELKPFYSVDVLHSYDHQDTLHTYGANTWVWITLTPGTIPTGKDKNKPTLTIHLDGHYTGYISAYLTQQYATNLLNTTTPLTAKAFIKRRKNGLNLIAYLPDK